MDMHEHEEFVLNTTSRHHKQKTRAFGKLESRALKMV